MKKKLIRSYKNIIHKKYYNQNKHKLYNIKFSQTIKIIILIFLGMLIVTIADLIGDYCSIDQRVTLNTIDFDEFRKIKISTKAIETLKEMGDKSDIEYSKLISLYMLLYHYDLSDLKHDKIINMNKVYMKKVINSEAYASLSDKYKAIFDELEYFPIPIQTNGDTTVTYEDSWQSARTYGGERFHEGTDLMSNYNVRGYIPVVSITNGIVEQMGWLEQGGYRIGIRTKSGGYFYYAHLYSYAPDLAIGDDVIAGQMLGFMGDSGYGKEGTTGQFDVHLHVGIYIENESKEMSVNPYWILKYLEKYKLKFYY